MGKGGVGKLASTALSGLSGGGGSSGGLTPDEQAMLQYQAQQEAQRETAFYADAGIPFSSGLAYDLGSIGQQTAANAATIEQGNQSLALQQQALAGNSAAALGGAAGGLANLGAGLSNPTTGGQ
jgi:hypothetical protein